MKVARASHFRTENNEAGSLCNTVAMLRSIMEQEWNKWSVRNETAREMRIVVTPLRFKKKG